MKRYGTDMATATPGRVALASIGAVAALLAVPAVDLLGSTATTTASPPFAPCYNGVAPLNPFVDNCALPNRPPRVRGSAPDQTAILNCSVGSQALRGWCLSNYVNG